MYGDDKFRAIELKYGNTSKLNGFLMFLLYWCDEDGPQRILGFALHSLVKLLRYKKLFLHIDATYDGAPQGFYQVVFFFSYGSCKQFAHAHLLLSYDQKDRGGI